MLAVYDNDGRGAQGDLAGPDAFTVDSEAFFLHARPEGGVSA